MRPDDDAGARLVDLMAEWTAEWLTASQVDRVLGIVPNTRRAIPPAELPYMRLGERGDRRYRVADVRAYIAKRTVR